MDVIICEKFLVLELSASISREFSALEQVSFSLSRTLVALEFMSVTVCEVLGAR